MWSYSFLQLSEDRSPSETKISCTTRSCYSRTWTAGWSLWEITCLSACRRGYFSGYLQYWIFSRQKCPSAFSWNHKSPDELTCSTDARISLYAARKKQSTLGICRGGRGYSFHRFLGVSSDWPLCSRDGCFQNTCRCSDWNLWEGMKG